jgi:hypothetical protein
MIERIQRSWDLVKASFNVLRADKELVIYPILSSIGMLIVTVSFALPTLITGGLQLSISERGFDFNFLGFIVVFLFYFAQYFVVTFCNSALVGAAMIRLRGGDPTLRDGFRIAFENIGIVLGYTAIASTVGMILRTLSERSRGLGRLAVGFVGLAWNLATFLVVPVLVVEGIGPLDAVKRSAQLLKKTWGEQIAGNLSIGLIFGLIILGLFAITLIPGIALSVWLENALIVIPFVIALILGIMLFSLLSSTLNGIYSAAVYRYAAEGQIGEFFTAEIVQEAFQTK